MSLFFATSLLLILFIIELLVIKYAMHEDIPWAKGNVYRFQ